MTSISLDIPDVDERGVSPVIGVILMVAVTVILAAVIATFVLGFGDTVQNNAQAGVTVDDGDVTVTSLGSNTDGVYCTNSGASVESGDPLAVVGDTITGCGGGNVVAVINDGNGDPATETVVRTDV